MTADWCTWCKKMDDQVFSQEDVGDFYNKNFINAKLDTETRTGERYSEEYMVESLPTILFLDDEGEVVYRYEGAVLDEDEFISHGQAALDIQKYNVDGTKVSDGQSLFHYVYFLAVSGEEAYEDEFERFLETDYAWDTEDGLAMTLALASVGDSLAKEVFMERMDDFEDALGYEVVLDVLVDIAASEAETTMYVGALLEEDPDQTLDDVIDVYMQYLDDTELARQEGIEALMTFYNDVEMYDEFCVMMGLYVEELLDPLPNGSDKAELYADAAIIICDRTDNEDHLKMALEWAQKSEKESPNYTTYDALSCIYESLGKKGKAKKYRKLAEKEGDLEIGW